MRQQPEHDGVGALAPNYPALALQALDPKPKALERSHGGHVARVGVALEAMQVKVVKGEVHDPSLGLVRVTLTPVLSPEDEAQLRSRLLALGQQRDRTEHTAVLVALDAPLQRRAVVEPVSDLRDQRRRLLPVLGRRERSSGASPRDQRRWRTGPRGNTRDRQGRLVTCEHDARRVTRTEYDGSITVILDRFDGKPLNSPNDVVVRSDDSVWFTDPPFGILSNYEGHVAPVELPTNVYRVDGRTGQATVVVGDIPRPNGLAFSPDEQKLYVVVSGAMPREIRAYDVVDNGTRLANGRVFIDCGAGVPDGFRVDTDGNLWCGWGGGEGQDGVAIFNPDGKLIGRILLPERSANLCFGGAKRNRLFIASSKSIYSVYVNARGATLS